MAMGNFFQGDHPMANSSGDNPCSAHEQKVRLFRQTARAENNIFIDNNY